MNTIPVDEIDIIYTYTPEEEIWHYVDKLTNKRYVKTLLENRIKENFFYRVDFSKLEEYKSTFNKSQTDNKAFTEINLPLS